MKLRPGILPGSLLLLLAAVTFAVGEEQTLIFVVKSPENLQTAAGLVAGKTFSTAEHVVVKIGPGDYVLGDTFRIQRSNTSVLAEPGAKFVLADGVNKPVVAVGTQKPVPAELDRIENIRISGLEIDGNKQRQPSELGQELPWIRNNGIDVRMVTNLTVENAIVKRSRSGGLVISWKSSDISVKHSVFDENFFDGVAYYDSVRIETVQCSMRNNQAAGISLDNDFADSDFTDCKLVGNQDVGIFVRFSKNVAFNRCDVEGSGSWGAFLAHDDADNGVHGIRFLKCRFTSNHGGVRMASVSEAQSSGTEIVDCAFRSNITGERQDMDTAGAPIRTEGGGRGP